MLKSVENLLNNKETTTYEDYKAVISELEEKMFYNSYFGKVGCLTQIETLEKAFPKFKKMKIEEMEEFDKELQEALRRMEQEKDLIKD